VGEGCVWNRDPFAGSEPGDVQSGAAIANPNGRYVPMLPHPRRYDGQPTLDIGWIEFQLLVTGSYLVFVGDDPHLDEIGWLIAAGTARWMVVALGVPDAGARGHSLRQIGMNHTGVTLRVLVHE
jgi:hypothetical protein